MEKHVDVLRDSSGNEIFKGTPAETVKFLKEHPEKMLGHFVYIGALSSPGISARLYLAFKEG